MTRTDTLLRLKRFRVDEMKRRIASIDAMVVISRMVGKDENSSGLRMNTAVIRIRIEKLSEKASDTSSSQVGSGRISTTRMAMIAASMILNQ